MSDQLKELADIPKDFMRDGTQFMNRCTKRETPSLFGGSRDKKTGADRGLIPADKREFIKISQAVGVGFVVMGAIGYVVKLSMFIHR